MSILSALIEPVAGIIGKLVPDKDQANQLAHDIATMADTHHQALMLQQIELNKIDAQSGRGFQANWRPFFGWVCGIAFLNNFVILTYFPTLPQADWAQMSPVVMGMLGLATQRTVEKVKGKA